MNDNQLISALITVIEDQLTLVNIENFEVSRNFQPSDQYAGADNDDAIKTRVYLHSITNPPMGHSRKYSTDNSQRADLQHMSETIQISVLHDFDYTDVNALTPKTMCNTVRALLDSPDAIKALRESNIFLQEVGDVRSIFFVNDKDQNESVPNFDLTVTYRSEIIKSTSTVTSVVDGIYNEDG